MFAIRHERDKVVIAIPRTGGVYLDMATAERFYHTLLHVAANALTYPPVRDKAAWTINVSVPDNRVLLRFTPPNEDVPKDRVLLLAGGAFHLAEAVKAGVTHLRGKEASRDI
jgi:hypothetical protein